jgi:hypothetical protein
MTYFKLEPEATARKPLIWTLIVKVDEGPNEGVAMKTLRRAPGEDRLTQIVDDE